MDGPVTGWSINPGGVRGGNGIGRNAYYNLLPWAVHEQLRL